MPLVRSAEILAISPVLRPARRGVLATAPPDAPFRIGVIGKDESDAARLFRDSVRAWAELHDLPEPPSEPLGV
jgi:hypothetical protein